MVAFEFIPIEQWGKDHWSLLLYIETCVVDEGGKLNHLRMRTYNRRNSEHPTRLKEGTVPLIGLHWHDDWNCLDDLEQAGLVINEGTGIFPVCRLTDYGWLCAHNLRRHKAEKNRKADDFVVPEKIKTDVHIAFNIESVPIKSGLSKGRTLYLATFADGRETTSFRGLTDDPLSAIVECIRQHLHFMRQHISKQEPDK